MNPMIENLRIESLAYGGNGVGRHEGKAVFVPLTAPGDRVRCRVGKDKKRYAEAEMTELLDPSGLRRQPPCPVFGECGGCQWQHLPYGEQCRQKEEIFADILHRQCGIDRDRVRPLAPSTCEWEYRSRVQFKCRQTEEGFLMGFFRRGSHFVVEVGSCPIAHPRINEALAAFRGWLAGSPAPHKVPQVDVEVGSDGALRALVHFTGEDSSAMADYLRPPAEEKGFSLFIQLGRNKRIIPVAGVEDLLVRAGSPPLELAYGPGGFAQVNLEQNRALVEEVLNASALAGGERVLDLFCGMGNFTLPLASRAGELVGVEDYAPSIAKAKQNALRNGIGNASFHARSAEGAARRFGGNRPFDLVLLDPPRSGAYEVVKDLLGSAPPRILYVSCDPPTLARDLKPLLNNGYELLWSRPFDLFPQTYHTESVTLLERRV